MAYYSGSVNSYADLVAAVQSACVSDGWTLSGSILSKGAAYLNLYSSTAKTSTEGPGLIAQGGTGIDAGVLTGGSVARPRLGPCGSGPLAGGDPSWPSVYHIHVFTDPDEVYVFLNHGISRYYYLAFGISDVPGVGGNGLWITGTVMRGFATGTTSSSGGFYISDVLGQVSGNPAAATGNGPWWVNRVWTGSMSDTFAKDILHCGIDGAGWKGGGVFFNSSPQIGALSALQSVRPLPTMQPNAWNGESVLLPIQVLIVRASLKVSPVLEHRNARYLRINNHEPGDIITLGSDRWRVYPFHMKNMTQPDGSLSMIDHTGTFGWAIRYDGP